MTKTHFITFFALVLLSFYYSSIILFTFIPPSASVHPSFSPMILPFLPSNRNFREPQALPIFLSARKKVSEKLLFGVFTSIQRERYVLNNIIPYSFPVRGRAPKKKPRKPFHAKKSSRGISLKTPFSNDTHYLRTNCVSHRVLRFCKTQALISPP